MFPQRMQIVINQVVSEEDIAILLPWFLKGKEKQDTNLLLVKNKYTLKQFFERVLLHSGHRIKCPDHLEPFLLTTAETMFDLGSPWPRPVDTKLAMTLLLRKSSSFPRARPRLGCLPQAEM